MSSFREILSSFRDIQKPSTSLGTWKSGFVSNENPWEPSSNEVVGSSISSIPAVYLQDGMSLHLSPSKNHRFQWNDTNFHSSLLQKMWSSNSLMLLFQAKARESISVALSPVADYSKELFYEIQFGAVGNTTTNIRRKQNKKQQQHVSIPSRVCKDESWISYWVCLQEQKVYAGMGEIPGENCIGVLEEKQQPEVTKVEKEQDGGGDDSKVVEENEESNMDAVVATPTDTTLPTIQYVGLGNCARGPKSQALSVQKVVLTTISPTVADKLRDLPEDLPTVVVDDEEGREMIKLMEEYRKECEIRKSRAEKFGTQYKQPARDEFIPWSKAKRLRENPEKGFITGIDLMDSDEVAKREARKARFGVVDNTDGDNEKEDEEGEGKKKGKDLPVSEAWDKEAMLRPQRKDPPSSMWNQPPSESSMEERDNFAMEQPEPTTLVPEKIHLFAIDWAAFKQIRNKDIMAYFSTYGPSYVEWLADLSCNVCFEDKYTASRAMMNLSQEIPTPPSESIKVDDDQPPDFGNMNWRFCRRPIRKIANDRHGRRNTTARILMRIALSTDLLDERPNTWPAPPGGFSSTKVLGPDSDFPRGRRQKGKRQRGDGSKEKEQRDGHDSDGNQGDLWLDRGLSSGRKGFSVEELEAERAKKKRAKTSPES